MKKLVGFNTIKSENLAFIQYIDEEGKEQRMYSNDLETACKKVGIPEHKLYANPKDRKLSNLKLESTDKKTFVVVDGKEIKITKNVNGNGFTYKGKKYYIY